MVREESDSECVITLLRTDHVELSADRATKLIFARRHARYLFEDCDRQGPETVVDAAKRDAERELTNRVWTSGRSYASCWAELMRGDEMRDWYRLAQLTPAEDDDRRFARIL